MVSFPNSKINLGLQILSKRSDDYHEIETVFYPIALIDALEIIPSQKFHFQTSGARIEGSNDDNLCVKAYDLLKKDFPNIPPVTIHLHKVIPTGGGLGGGSADAAFMLVMLNKKFNLNISLEKLCNYALQLGSDCPFFIINKPCFATGRGEKLEPIELAFSAYKMVIVNPGIHVSTKEAFAMLTPHMPSKSIRQIIFQPVETWKQELLNDFEEPVFRMFPSIRQIKQSLYDAGAVYASMSGSGSTVFGFFDKDAVPDLSFDDKHFVRIIG